MQSYSYVYKNTPGDRVIILGAMRIYIYIKVSLVIPHNERSPSSECIYALSERNSPDFIFDSIRGDSGIFARDSRASTSRSVL